MRKDLAADYENRRANRRDYIFGVLALLPGLLGLWTSAVFFIPEALEKPGADKIAVALKFITFGALFFGYAIHRFYRIYRRKQTRKPLTSR